jgi:uncharacterized peroxidase-related enzyme
LAYLESLPDDAVLMQVFTTFPEHSRPLLDYHELVMRGPSPFTPGEREMIAAYVSGINACGYCHGVHTVTAEAFGLPPGVLEAALADLDSAPVEEKLKPVLRYAGKLTSSPSRVSQADVDTVLAAGWDEVAVYHAILVCALFNFMNRLVDGLGIRAGSDFFEMSGNRLHRIGYAGLSTLIDE